MAHRAVRPRSCLALAVSIAVACVWIALLLSVVSEQRGAYQRRESSIGYTVEQAYARALELEVRRYTTELFNPNLQRALKSYPIINDMHSARYIGACLVPLIVLFLVLRWRQTDRWVFTLTACVLGVTLCAGVLLRLWEMTPTMPQIGHGSISTSITCNSVS